MTNEEEKESFDVLERHLCDVFKPGELRFRATVLPQNQEIYGVFD